MRLKRFFILFFLLFFTISCSKENIKKSVIQEKNLDSQVAEAYEKGFEALEKGDVIYVFSDGYADQFGGVSGKKFMYKQFRETLLSIQSLSMEEQQLTLDKKIEDWKGSYEQVDDILVIGVKIN